MDERRLTLADGEREDLYATPATVARPTVVHVPPQSVRYVDLYFPLPYRLQREVAVPSFDVVWTVRAGSLAVTRRTPFQRFLAAPPSSSLSQVLNSKRAKNAASGPASRSSSSISRMRRIA